MALKQSVCLPAYPTELPRKAFFKQLKEIGFAAVEIWGRDESFTEVSDLARENGLVLCSMIGHESIPGGLNDPQNHPQIEDELKRSVDIAADHDIPGVICFSGNRREGVPRDESIAASVEGLRRVTPYAEDKGVNLNLELLNSKVDHAGYECDSTAWGLEVVKRVGSPRAKLLYDIYHMQIMEGDIIRTVTGAISYIGHFHTAGNPGRHEMNDNQELNYRGICSVLTKLDYDGYIGHEFFPQGDMITGLKEAFAICDV